MLARLTFTATLFATLLAASGSRATDLVLLEQATPKTGVVRLADVAAILNATPDAIERLGKLPIMPAPAPGASHKLRAQGVRELLAAHGVDMTTLRFRGAETVAIALRDDAPIAVDSPSLTPQAISSPQRAPLIGFRDGSTTTNPSTVSRPHTIRLTAARRQQLLDRLTDQLSHYVQQQTGDAMLYVTGIQMKDNNAATLAAHDGPIEISTTTSLGRGMRRFLIMFQTTRGEVKFPVTGDVVEARPAVLVRREVPRGMTITAADVHVAPLPLDFRPRGIEVVAESVEEVIGKEAARRLAVDDVVTDGNCLPPLMVERGALVRVLAGNGAIRVTTQAKAMRQGRQGEIIEVQSLDTNARFMARVVGRGQLAVLSAGAQAVRSVASSVESTRLR